MSKLDSVLNISEEELRKEIKDEYAQVARDPHQEFHFHTGRAAATRLGYNKAMYDDFPESAIESFAGVGNPFILGPIEPGETVVDAGSGAGFDALIAARLVGDDGKVIGIDMTPEMIDKARRAAEERGCKNVEYHEGFIDDMPLEDDFADVLISNGVLNLSLDKVRTLKEWYRVLKPGGRLQIGDILVARPVPQSGLDDISLWTG